MLDSAERALLRTDWHHDGRLHDSSDHYWRMFFNGLALSDGLFFGATLSFYPRRQLLDAAVAVQQGSRVTCLFAGRRPTARHHTAVGPVYIDVARPLRRVTLRVRHSALRATLTFKAGTNVHAEPRCVQRQGDRLWLDYRRDTQFGTWHGWVETASGRHRVKSSGTPGVRDWSRGIRPLGARHTPLVRPPQVFWLWATIHMPGESFLVALHEDEKGVAWHSDAAVLTSRGRVATQARWLVRHRLEWHPGTRRITGGELCLVSSEGHERRLEFTAVTQFPMAALGYWHPERGHGTWDGRTPDQVEHIDISSLDLSHPRNFHLQQLCRVSEGGNSGTGIVEHQVVGPHEPSGFTRLFDTTPGVVTR